MLTAHHTVAFLVLAVTWAAAIFAGIAYYRRREPRGFVTHLLALAQTLHRRPGRARPPAPLGAPPLAAPSALSLRRAGARRRARSLALCARRPAQAARLVRGGYPGGRSARRAGVLDRHMRSFFSRMNPTLRGFLIILTIVLLVVVLQLEATLAALLILARIAFLLAIAFVVFLMWRERREEIAVWPLRARIVFYGAALLAVVDLAVNWYGGASGLQVLAFVGVLVLLRPRHVAHLARPAPLRVAQRGQASTRAVAPSSAASASRIATCWPTKIGVSRNV